jgi:hypothetical protein
MKIHYHLKAKDASKFNDGMFLACKATWRHYNSKFSYKKSKVTCIKCIMAIDRKKLEDITI